MKETSSRARPARAVRVRHEPSARPWRLPPVGVLAPAEVRRRLDRLGRGVEQLLAAISTLPPPRRWTDGVA